MPSNNKENLRADKRISTHTAARSPQQYFIYFILQRNEQHAHTHIQEARRGDHNVIIIRNESGSTNKFAI
jgi:hypothetical protein